MYHYKLSIESGKCHPELCKRECIKYCPLRTFGGAIDIEDISGVSDVLDAINTIPVCLIDIILSYIKPVANINQNKCIHCGICLKKCPFNAIIRSEEKEFGR